MTPDEDRKIANEVAEAIFLTIRRYTKNDMVDREYVLAAIAHSVDFAAFLAIKHHVDDVSFTHLCAAVVQDRYKTRIEIRDELVPKQEEPTATGPFPIDAWPWPKN